MRNKQFKKIYIEITNRCNLQCPFCPTDRREKRNMTQEEFEHILQQVKEYTDYLYFHIKGEPLLHPKINEMIEQAVEYGFKVNLTTNGTCLERLTTKKIRQINYSLQSTKSIEQMQRILYQLKEIARTTQTYISIRLWRSEIQQDQKILNLLKAEFPNLENLQDKEKLEEQIYLSIEEEFEWPDLENKVYKKQGYCHGTKDHIGILVDGTVIPCCLDHKACIPLGNIFVQEISEILQSSRMKTIQEGFKKRQAVEELCQKCGFKERFSRNQKGKIGIY